MKSTRPYNFEYRVFRWLLSGSIIFWIYRVAIHLLLEDYTFDLMIDFFTLVITIVLIFVLKKYQQYDKLIQLYCFFLIVGYIYFWYRLGGLNGPISYSYFALITFFITILPTKRREVLAVLFCGFTVLLSLNIPDRFFNLLPITSSTELLLPFDYVISSLIISLIVIIMKRNFDNERNLLQENNIRINALNQEQEEKTGQLLDQQQKIRSIKENLEKLVKDRTLELELKNKQLKEYAFHNAHLVRKPLSNIIGLISILEKEDSDIDDKSLKVLKEKVEELNIITRKINLILQ